MTALIEGRRAAVAADTGEQVRDLNTAIRAARAEAGHVNDKGATTTLAGDRIGVGDVVATRRNDRQLNVANRDTWTVTAVTPDGGAAGHRFRSVPGFCPPATPRSTSNWLMRRPCMGCRATPPTPATFCCPSTPPPPPRMWRMTRGRHANTVHIVADTLDDAKDQWIAAFGRDRADLGVGSARADAERAVRDYAHPRPLDTVLGELHEAWTAVADARDLLDRAQAHLNRVAVAHGHDQALADGLTATRVERQLAEDKLVTLAPRLTHAEARGRPSRRRNPRPAPAEMA